jgi:hypothetical protein
LPSPPRLPLRGSPHDFHSVVRGEINRCFAHRSITHESRVTTRPQVKPNSCYEYQDAKFQKNSTGKEMLAPPRFTTSPEVGPGATVGTLRTRYPRVQVLGQDRRRDMQITCPYAWLTSACPCVLRTQLPLPSPGQLRDRHVSGRPSSRCPARGSSGAATCSVDPAPAAQPGAAPGPPRLQRHQLPLPSPGQLWGRHVSCGLSSRCPARGSSRAATCALEAQWSLSC